MCFLWEGEYTWREVWQKLHRGGGIHQVGGYDPPFPWWTMRPCGLSTQLTSGGTPICSAPRPGGGV